MAKAVERTVATKSRGMQPGLRMKSGPRAEDAGRAISTLTWSRRVDYLLKAYGVPDLTSTINPDSQRHVSTLTKIGHSDKYGVVALKSLPQKWNDDAERLLQAIATSSSTISHPDILFGLSKPRLNTRLVAPWMVDGRPVVGGGSFSDIRGVGKVVLKSLRPGSWEPPTRLTKVRSSILFFNHIAYSFLIVEIYPRGICSEYTRRSTYASVSWRNHLVLACAWLVPGWRTGMHSTISIRDEMSLPIRLYVSLSLA